MEQEPLHKLAHTRATFLLLIFLLLVAVENMARAILSVQQAVELPLLPASPSPIYVAVGSAAWAIALGICIFGLSRLNPWAQWATISVASLYQGWLWINRLVFERATETLATSAFRAGLSVLFLMIVMGILALPGTRRLFADARVYLDSLRTVESPPSQQTPVPYNTTHAGPNN